MSRYQYASFAFIVLYLTLGWAWRRRPGLVCGLERGLALALLGAAVADLATKLVDSGWNPALCLPMQLCDWALFAVAAALWWRWPAAFDLAYFWGLAGTFQALLTPAIAAELFWLRQAGFFFLHAGIVAGVLHLVINAKLRPRSPRSLVRIAIASEIYLVAALAVNWLTKGNYGFLSQKPATHSLLDYFAATHGLYVLELNLVAFFFFCALYLPWWFRDRVGAASSRAVRRDRKIA